MSGGRFLQSQEGKAAQMQVSTAVLTAQGVREEEVRLGADWRLRCGEDDLELRACVDCQLGALCVFASKDTRRQPVEASFACRELLLYPPVVPLRKTERGFQALRREELLVARETPRPKRLVASEAAASATTDSEDLAEVLADETSEAAEEPLSCEEPESCSSGEE